MQFRDLAFYPSQSAGRTAAAGGSRHLHLRPRARAARRSRGLLCDRPDATQEEIAQVRTALGLDKPLAEQLVRYFKDISVGDLGRSLVTGQLVSSDLRERFPASFELTFVAMLLALSLSIPLGIVAAIRAGSWIDHVIRFVGTLGVSMPAFVAGIVLIFVFYFKLGLTPEPIRPHRSVCAEAARRDRPAADRFSARRRSRGV